jgi:hypothetical protein
MRDMVEWEGSPGVISDEKEFVEGKFLLVRDASS